jgi:hypothetical protein
MALGPVLTDAVEKDFAGISRATLIQDQRSMRNFDSKSACLDSFVSYSNSTVPLRRLFRQHRPQPDIDRRPAASRAYPTGDSSVRARFSNRRPFARGSHPAFSWMRDREDLTHILGERFAKALGIRRHWTPLVPLNGKSLSNRLAPVCYADDPQCVAIRSQ